MVVSTI